MRTGLVIFIFLLGINGIGISQYQFPLDAIEKLKKHTSEYADMVNTEKYLHFQMETYSRRSSQTSDVRTTDFYKNDKMVIINSDEMSYYIDDSLMIILNDDAQKIYIKQIESEDEMATGYINSLVNAFDSIMFYTSSVTYNEGQNIKYECKIAPKNYYKFDNLMYQNIYYSEGAVLPDSIVKGYYSEQLYEEITYVELVSKTRVSSFPYSEVKDYFFNAKEELIARYKNYSISKL